MKKTNKLDNFTQLKTMGPANLDAINGGLCGGESWWGIAKWYWGKAKKVAKEFKDEAQGGNN